MGQNVDNTNPKDRLGVLKAPLRLVPPALAIETARAMANGAKKYGPYNWRDTEVRVTVYLEAILRHVMAYMDGEETAEDSGIDHLAHAAAGLAIIFDARAVGTLLDDRPTRGPAAKLLAMQDQTDAASPFLGPKPPEDELPLENPGKRYRAPYGGASHYWTDDCDNMGCREVTNGKD